MNIRMTCNPPAACSELPNESAYWTLSDKRRRTVMMKYILAVALVAPLMVASSMAQEAPRIVKHVYVGGPASNIPHATKTITSGAADAFAMAPKAKASQK